MTTSEHAYRTNYRLLAGAWLATFFVLVFSFHICGLKGRKELTVADAVREAVSGDYPEPEDVRDSLSAGCMINATAAIVFAWPLQAISVVALGFVRRRVGRIPASGA